VIGALPQSDFPSGQTGVGSDYRATVSFDRLSPVFPVRDIDSAVEHYGKLGFSVRRFEGQEPYAFAERDGIELHLAEVDDLRPKRNMSAVYLYVDDADALYREWARAGIDGRLVEPSDTSYGLREGACLDRDANLIRFGSAIANGKPDS
jgi:hypothetical protein